ncbi:B-cell differentiation antigen CD72 isoform X2 [Panthera onca]|uniref:B-cell differentiation antigen CD72 isoform X2 n=1 Tax=Panthera tigris TaxID=9694 RepID=UPI001C6FC072|nr:B-cell differentiation antigen CD72 isoform X2 [Panthera tigris]
MAEAITYADLRFVKAPLKKSVSSRSGQEADEDEELTYENVQVPSVSVSGGPLSLASSGVGDKADWSSHRSARLQAEQPTASWSSVASPAAGRILTDLQGSQQLQQMNSVLEATNSSLRQQLHLKITQLGKREEDLQGSKRELALSQEALQEEQRVHQATQEQLQACQSDREKTKEALQSEEVQRRTLEQRLSRMQDTMKPLFTCPLSDTCCPSGWILNEKSCFYISLTARTWDESQNHCKSLSSDLATFNEIYYPSNYLNSARKMLTEVNPPGSFWAISSYIKMRQQADSKKSSGSYGRSSRCYKVQTSWPKGQQEDCTSHLPCICEMAAFGNPDKDYSLP